MTDVMTEIRFWSMVLLSSRQIVLCNPDLESRLKGWVNARDLGGMIKICPSPVVPKERAFVMSETPATADLFRHEFGTR